MVVYPENIVWGYTYVGTVVVVERITVGYHGGRGKNRYSPDVVAGAFPGRGDYHSGTGSQFFW